ncbi:hypothetical protein U0070_006382 [Myodes glareolus]|uniref:Uncharacterized protein n=1 Tax=Myodes glareolus TaxID=447135 RepID=A0AAW0HZJ2_MYOGA
MQVQEGEHPNRLDPKNPVYAEETNPSVIVNGFSERPRASHIQRIWLDHHASLKVTSGFECIYISKSFRVSAIATWIQVRPRHLLAGKCHYRVTRATSSITTIITESVIAIPTATISTTTTAATKATMTTEISPSTKIVIVAKTASMTITKIKQCRQRGTYRTEAEKAEELVPNAITTDADNS